VIRQPENLPLAAGLIAIVAPASPADWELLWQTVPAEQRVRVENMQ